jgi:predicted dehydrogenase
MEKPIEVCLLGAGSRGYLVFGRYAAQNPEKMKVIAVAEPNKEKRERFAKEHNIPENMCFESWQHLLSIPKLCDYLINATIDSEHFESTQAALEKGYNILLEKPMAVSPGECVQLVELAGKNKRTIDICHVLRHSLFFKAIRDTIEAGEIGDLVSVDLRECVGYYHYASSYIRGNWRNEKESSPMILAKSSHDMDILLWITGKRCKKLSSFGSLKHFKLLNKPEGATERCIDSCPHERTCPYSAKRIYLDGGWGRVYITGDTSDEGVITALKEGPYGRCIYQCDNDVVDHQVVNYEFEDEVTAVFTMCGTTAECNRYISVFGTRGEINGNLEEGKISLKKYIDGNVEKPKEQIWCPGTIGDSHGGGDFRMMDDFINRIVNRELTKSSTDAEISLESHIMAFAAEKSRRENIVVDIMDYTESLRKTNLNIL